MKYEEMYIDIDNDYDRFLRSKTWKYINENWKYVIKIVGYSPFLYYRRSSSGHVHLKLLIDDSVGILERFQIRSLLHDDPWRIGIDLRRLAIQGPSEIDRIFHTKFKSGVFYSVGEWKDISLFISE